MINITILPYMYPTAYNDGSMASDYQLDMVYHGLSQLPDVHVQQIPPNPVMFQTCPKEELGKVWGKGMTLYGLLPPPKSNFEVEDSDLIILALHHTACNDQYGFYQAVKGMVDKFGKDKICVIDGSDRTEYSDETANLCKYFKRELLDDRTTALPLFFGVPEEKFTFYTRNTFCDNCSTNPPVKKIYDFSPMVPANYCWEGCEHLSSYVYKTEEEYYLQYQQSYFAYSCKKGGWATGRQNEIIINQCIPYITDLETYPKNCLFRYPKDLCIEAKKMKGVIPGTVNPYNPQVDTYIGDTRQIKPGEARGRIDRDIFDETEYYKLQKEFFNYAWKNLTTKRLAAYIIEEVLH